MYFLSVQPDSDYFIWQIIVQINNFRKLGIEENMVILLGYNHKQNPKIETLKEYTKARIFVYEDNRTNQQRKYIPSIRPYLLKKFFIENPIIFENSSWMYHDSDILFREVPVVDENVKCVYLSDTKSYLDSKYIKGKGTELFKRMCDIVKISPAIVEKNDSKCGGAQYIFTKNINLDGMFWSKVMNDSLNLYNLMETTSMIYSPNHPVQSWTADMWAVLWNLWSGAYETQITDELSFSWATSGISEWDRYKIFHNAGVTSNDKQLFFKGNYINKSPFQDDLSFVNQNTCSYKYVEEILDTKKSLNHFS